jgi:hypothetical protein
MENTTTKIISIHKLTKVFKKVYLGANQEQLKELEKELMKVYPSEESEVLFSTDYSEEDNSVGISIYVSNPVPATETTKLELPVLMSQYLNYADVRKLPSVFECLERMEQQGKDIYELDFIPVFYNEDLDDHYIHIRFFKLR